MSIFSSIRDKLKMEAQQVKQRFFQPAVSAVRREIPQIQQNFQQSLPTPTNFSNSFRGFQTKVIKPIQNKYNIKQNAFNIKHPTVALANETINPVNLMKAGGVLLKKTPTFFNPQYRKDYSQGINDISQRKFNTPAAQNQAMNAGFMTGSIENASKNIVDNLVKSNTVQNVVKSLGKYAVNYGDNVIKLLAKEKDAGKIGELLKNTKKIMEIPGGFVDRTTGTVHKVKQYAENLPKPPIRVNHYTDQIQNLPPSKWPLTKNGDLDLSQFPKQVQEQGKKAFEYIRKNGKYAGRRSLDNNPMYGGIAGIETYQDKDGKTKIRFNPYKAMAGMAVMGGVKYAQDAGKVGGEITSNASKRLDQVPQSTPKLLSTPEAPISPSTGSIVPTATNVEKSLSFDPNISQTQGYINSQVNKQKSAAQNESVGLVGKVKNAISDIKRKLVDSTAPIEDILYKAKKEGANISPSADIHNQFDRVYRSRELAGQFAKDNGLVDAIKGAPDINALDQYLIAKHSLEVATVTGRDIAKDKALVTQLGLVYEPFAQKVVQYGQKVLDKAVETGLVSQETANMLKSKYPNYVPLNRIFSEIEKTVPPEGVGKSIASLSKQTVVQKLKGSERAIANPTESLLTKTLDVFSQGERNVAGSQLASYRDLPAFKGLIRELKPGESAVHTFSYLDNGVKRTFETTPEIASAAKMLDKRQMGFIGQIFAAPVRIARVGITGLNIPFISSNIVKDQVSGFINSDKALQTSIANPVVFLKSAWEAIGHGKEYDNWIRSAGGGTSFDISRSAPNVSVAKIRSGKNIGTKIAYTVTHPGELFRTAENIVSRGEELTRLQQFIGTRDTLLKQGMSKADAEILAAKQSREATVNFARSGDWGKALNSAFLYINAGIQGSRTLVTNLARRPVQTSAKIALTVFAPLAAITAWNISDPQRKAAYDDIRDFEKENNLVIVPPNPTKDASGKWNVIKIPYSQEVANLTIPVRKGIESLAGYDAPGFADFAKAIIGSTTSLNVQSGQQLAGQFIPQAVKPGMEALLNKNTFTGTDIVSQSQQQLPNEMQGYSNTSGTARKIAGVLKTSPLKVEQFIKSSFGGVGSQALNASDQALAATGIIPKEQIGGQSIISGIKGRFAQATGGQQLTNLYDNKKVKGSTNPTPSTQGLPANTSGVKLTTPNIVENKGTFYLNIGGKMKTFDTQELAVQANIENDFKQSGKTSAVIGDTRYSLTKSNSVTSTPEMSYQHNLMTAKLTSLKANGDYKGYMDLGNKQLDNIEQQLNDPTLDDLEKQKLLNEGQTLATAMAKYQGYGGFTKGKAAKKAKVYNIAGVKAIQIKTPKGTYNNVKISKPRLSTFKLAAYKGSRIKSKKYSFSVKKPTKLKV